MYKVDSQGSNLRQWVNWKYAMTFFVLLNSPILSEVELTDLQSKLSPDSEEFLSKDGFLHFSFWFDSYEGKPSSALEAQWAAEKKALRDEDSDYYSDYDVEEETTPRYDD